MDDLTGQTNLTHDLLEWLVVSVMVHHDDDKHLFVFLNVIFVLEAINNLVDGLLEVLVTTRQRYL